MKIEFDDIEEINDIAEHEIAEEARQTANQSELARRFKITRNSVVERLHEAGIEPIDRGGKHGTRYIVTPELEEVLQEDGRSGPSSNRKTAAQERKLEAEAELKELQVQKELGEWVPLNEVEIAAVNLIRAMYLRLIGYCDDSALELSRMVTRGEVAAHQKKHIGTIMQQLREDPNNFITKNLEPSSEFNQPRS